MLVTSNVLRQEGHAKAGAYPAAHVDRGLPKQARLLGTIDSKELLVAIVIVAQVKCGSTTKTWDAVGVTLGMCWSMIPFKSFVAAKLDSGTASQAESAEPVM